MKKYRVYQANLTEGGCGSSWLEGEFNSLEETLYFVENKKEDDRDLYTHYPHGYLLTEIVEVNENEDEEDIVYHNEYYYNWR